MTPIAWVCVGTNPDTVVPTWFYAFRSSKQAHQFLAHVAIKDHTISWDLYPCEFMNSDDTFSLFCETLSKE